MSNNCNLLGSFYFVQVPHGNTEKAIQVRARVDQEIGSAKDFLQTNKIPGREIFYALIKIILSRYYHLNQTKPIEALFEEAWAYGATAELIYRKNGIHFDKINFKKLGEIYPTTIWRRSRFIKKYARWGPPFPEPIYIQEKILEDLIGSRVDERNMVMVDGARRIVAGCLCHLKEMRIILITKKKLENFKRE
jgi:hypothetical protein